MTSSPEKLDRMLELVSKWLDQREMEANASKCAVMACGENGLVRREEMVQRSNDETTCPKIQGDPVPYNSV
jgi:hypothetical protein